MFEWKPEYKWSFSPAGPSISDQGAAITGEQIFRGGAYKNVIRETVQNGLDARDDNLPKDEPVKMVYEYMQVDRADVPGIDRLSKVIDLCYEYMSSKEDVKMDDINVLHEANDRYLKSNPTVPLLKISDFGTTGLEGTKFSSLLRNEGITYKTGDKDSAGSFGFGKFAPFRLSPVNTILYSTMIEGGKYMFQGRSLLSTFKENGRRMQGMSMFGKESEDGQEMFPVIGQDEVPAFYRRSEKGTDLYVMCFEKDEDWIDQAAICALENFFFSIWQGKLEVAFRDGEKSIILDKDSLPVLMDYYKELHAQRYEEKADNFEFTAPIFWQAINNEKSVKITEKNFRNKGEVVLYLLTEDGMEDRSVLQMRSSGMKIRIAKDWVRLQPFTGVMIATGAGKESAGPEGNISKLLKELEGPAHDSWDLESLKKPYLRDEAEKTLKALKSWIRKAVKDRTPQEDGSPVDAFGMGKVLPDVTEKGEDVISEEAVLTFKPLPPIMKDASEDRAARPLRKRKNGRGHKDDPNPVPRPKPDEDREKKHRNNHQRDKVVARPISLGTVRTPYISEKSGYKLCFTPKADSEELLIKVSVSGDDGFSSETVLEWALADGKNLSIRDGFVHVPKVRKGMRTTIEVGIAETEPCALEVTGYVRNKD